MDKPEIYKKDQKYNIIYSDQDGKDNEFEFTPEEDMTKPKMIMKCKEANKNFIKLKEIKKLEEGVRKMEETKLEEGIFNREYVINCIIGGTQGYVGNDLEKAEDNLYEKAEDAMIFDSKDEAKKIAIDLELGYNANEVEILPYKKANKIDKKEESFESNKEYSAGTILAIIDNYINSDDIPNLFDRMGITQEIYEGDEEIPEGKIQDIIEIGLEWLFEHLQEEDYRRILKDDLEMTDEEMEKYGVELEESKKIEEADENSFKPEVDDYYFLNNNLIWDERIGDLAIGIGLSQLESIKKTEDLTGVTIDENIKKYLEEHPANLFVVEGQIPDIKVTLLGDQSGNPVKIDNLRVGG